MIWMRLRKLPTEKPHQSLVPTLGTNPARETSAFMGLSQALPVITKTKAKVERNYLPHLKLHLDLTKNCADDRKSKRKINSFWNF